MITMLKLSRIVIVASSVALAGPAMAKDLCVTSGKAQKSPEEITKMLTDQGYQVKKLKEEDGCIEAKGFDKEGHRVEVYVHPETGEIVKVKSS